MDQSRRLKELRDDIEARSRLPEPPFVVGLSGGADSAALALLSAGESRCLHVHHGLPWSDTLAGAAEEIAAKLDLRLDVVEVEIGEGPSPEAMAREARYAAFDEAVETGERLLLGHTMNDQAETLLLNLLRGAGTRGLAGMPYHRPPNIYRPLLGVRRSETRELAALAGLPFVDDPTNADQRLRRNRLRLDIMPRLEELNPGVVEGLARTAEHVRADADHLDAEASRVANLLVGDSEARVAAASLIVLDSPIRARVLSAMVGSLREQPHLTSDEIGRVEQVLLGQTAAAQIEGQIRVERDGPHLVCRVEG